MSKKAEQDVQSEALATFAAAARNNGIKPAYQGVSATRRPLASWMTRKSAEKEATDTLGGAATGDRKRVDPATAHHSKTGRRAG